MERIRIVYRNELRHTNMEQMQILSPFRSEGATSSNGLNEAIREEINPTVPDKPEVTFGGKLFRLHDRVMQMKNDYDIILYDRDKEPVGKGVFNGEIGVVCAIQSGTVTANYGGRFAEYPLESLGGAGAFLRLYHP